MRSGIGGRLYSARSRGEAQAETSADDTMKTVRLIFAAYQSARTGQVIHFGS